MRANIFELNLQPREIQAGQVWYLKSLNLEVLIIDDTPQTKYGFVNAVVLMVMNNITDGNDVIFQHEEYPTPRIAMRMTYGPVPVSELAVYRCDVSLDIIEKIRESVKNEDYSNFDEYQLSVVDQILEALEVVRAKAVKDYENIYSKLVELNTKIEALPDMSLGNFDYYKTYSNSLAAADYEIEDKIIEFWDKELENKDTAIKLINDEKLKIRISFVDNLPYLVVYSVLPKCRFGNLVIKNAENKMLFNKKDMINVQKRYFIPLVFQASEGDKFFVEFDLNNKHYKFEFQN